MSCISRPKQPLGWGSPCHRLHMNSLRYSCYLLTIDQVSTDHRPSVDQLLTDTSVKYQRTIGEVSAKSRRSVSEVSVNEKHDRLSSEYRPSLDRLSTDYRPLYRPTIDRYIDRVSTDYWSTAISTDRWVDTAYSKRCRVLFVIGRIDFNKSGRIHFRAKRTRILDVLVKIIVTLKWMMLNLRRNVNK